MRLHRKHSEVEFNFFSSRLETLLVDVYVVKENKEGRRDVEMTTH